MEAFFKKYSEKINEKSVLNRQGCMVWQGCIKKGPVGYGVINAKFPDAQWHTMHVHRLLYMVHNKILYVEPHLEVSHLCHVPLCVSAYHLSLEPHSINTERLKCVNRAICCGHGVYRDCIFV